MKKLVALFILISSYLSVNAQNIYHWENENITFTSPIKLQNSNSTWEISFEGDGIKINFIKVSGLEGFSDLQLALDGYASSFDYTVKGKAESVKELKNLDAAMIEVLQNGKPVILSLFSTLDYKNDYICEITFTENLRNQAKSIIKSLTTSQKISVNSDNQVKNKIINKAKETNKKYEAKTDLEKRTLDLLSRYSPDGYHIVISYLQAPNSYQGYSVSNDPDFTRWIDGKSENDILTSINTLVHETCHGYTGKLYLKALMDAGMDMDNSGYSAFYLGNEEMKLVKHSKVFLSKEINNIVPNNLKTSRYKLYVYPSSSSMGSQLNGIYGLFDEYNAYYNGTKTSLDFYKYYLENKNNPKGWLQFLSDFYGNYFAYLEFKTFMLIYMNYAEQKHKDVYDGILANEDFLYAFRKNDELWRKLIMDFIALKAEITQNLKKQGHEVSDNKGFTFIDGQGVGSFSEIYESFQKELKNTKYETIARKMGISSASGPELGF